MADLLLDQVSLAVHSLSVEPWAPGQAVEVNPYLAAEEVSGPPPGAWRGDVRFTFLPGHDRYRSADAAMLALAARTRGRAHRLKVPLSGAYVLYPDFPDGAAATIKTAQVVADGACVATLNKVGFGDWAFKAGGWLNIGDRLYFVDKVDGENLHLLPGVLPLAFARPLGLQSVAEAPVATGYPVGMGVYRGSLYVTYYRSDTDRTDCYWVDPVSGAHRVIFRGQAGVSGLGSWNNGLWALGGTAQVPEALRVFVDATDTDDNGVELLVTWGPSGDGRLEGVAEWRPSGSRASALYAVTQTKLWRLTRALPGARLDGETWADWFEEVVLPTAFSRALGLAVGPDNRLWILDAGSSQVWTWDGVSQVSVFSGNVGLPAGATLAQCSCIEWASNQLLLGRTSPADSLGLYRINVGTPLTAPVVEVRNPFVMMRLDGGAVGPAGADFPAPVYGWTEAASR